MKVQKKILGLYLVHVQVMVRNEVTRFRITGLKSGAAKVVVGKTSDVLPKEE